MDLSLPITNYCCHNNFSKEEDFIVHILVSLKNIIKINVYFINKLLLLKNKLKSHKINNNTLCSMFESFFHKFAKECFDKICNIFKHTQILKITSTQYEIKIKKKMFVIGGNICKNESDDDILIRIDNIFVNHLSLFEFVKLKYILTKNKLTDFNTKNLNKLCR